MFKTKIDFEQRNIQTLNKCFVPVMETARKKDHKWQQKF